MIGHKITNNVNQYSLETLFSCSHNARTPSDLMIYQNNSMTKLTYAIYNCFVEFIAKEKSNSYEQF